MSAMIEAYIDDFSKGDLGLIRRAILKCMQDSTLSYYDFDKYADLYYKIRQLQCKIRDERKEQWFQ